MESGYAPVSKEIPILLTIYKLYEQQQYMYKNKTHSVDNRIVNITQPWLRPIVRGKTKASVEFGAKFDLSLDDSGSESELGIIRNAYLQTRYIAPGPTEVSEKLTEYDYQVLSLEDQVLQNSRKYSNMSTTK